MDKTDSLTRTHMIECYQSTDDYARGLILNGKIEGRVASVEVNHNSFIHSFTSGGVW